MLLHLIVRGKIGRSAEAELVDRYLKRIDWKVKVSELPDTGGTIPVATSTSVRHIVLDEGGEALRSTELAARLERWRDDGVREARFLIGAADGHPADVIDDADLILGFGPATWPHMLCRAMLAEQLYRATTIIAGHPYHREGSR